MAKTIQPFQGRMGGLGQGLGPRDSCMEMTAPLLGPVLCGLRVGVAPLVGEVGRVGVNIDGTMKVHEIRSPWGDWETSSCV